MHIEQLHIDMEDERFILESSFTDSLKKLLVNQTYCGVQLIFQKIQNLQKKF